MNYSPPTGDLKREHRTNSIICGAMIAALFVYAGVVELLRRQPHFAQAPVQADLLHILRPVFYALSAFHLVAIMVLRGVMLKRPPDARVETLVGRFRVVAIVTSAISEATAIYGLVLFMIGRDSRDFYPLCAYSLLLQIAYFPTYRRMESWVKGGKRLD